MTGSELTLRARYVFPVAAPPIESASVRISGERITGVGPAGAHCDIDLGNAAILPGLVNAHTHLELSAIGSREFSGTDFANWLSYVIAKRGAQSPAQIAHAVSRGIDASMSAGTTLLADVSTSGRSWKELVRSPLRAVVFAELIGLKYERAAQTAQAARQFLEWVGPVANRATKEHDTGAADDATPAFRFGAECTIVPFPQAAPISSRRRLTPSLSPHAPYSTHESLYNLAAHWGERAGVPICTHLAETEDELRLLRQRDGRLRDFLMSIGAWQDDWQPAGPGALDYIEGRASGCADWLLAHANYLTDDEIARLAQHTSADGPQRAVVYCPRTHAYFGHRRHPFAKMLAEGLVVCLGTDSLASTNSLSILDEMRFLRRRESSLEGATILNMATLAGARALRREHECGSLSPGKYADLAVVRLPDCEAGDPHDLLLNSDEPVLRTMIGGRFVFQRR
jgi:cytosine/adenosine deaminase-related metal-dependent hydrolase